MSFTAIHFRGEPNIKPGHSISIYKESDYALIVGPSHQAPRQTHRISIDSLNLLVSPEEHILVGLDAYTNAARWAQLHLELPEIHKEAGLFCLEAFDQHGIGESRTVGLDYTYSSDNGILRIKIAGRQPTTYIRCLSSVVCGLSAQNELVELWIEQLSRE
jgi:hypothetical protein